jgi:hypothetical protein
VSVSKPFKHLVRKDYDARLNKDNHILTPSGKIKRASVPVIVEWIKSLERSASHYYSKIVLKCCLSDVEDGMQDDNFWDDSEQSGEGASSSENESANERSLDQFSD